MNELNEDEYIKGQIRQVEDIHGEMIRLCGGIPLKEKTKNVIITIKLGNKKKFYWFSGALNENVFEVLCNGKNNELFYRYAKEAMTRFIIEATKKDIIKKTNNIEQEIK